MENISSFLINNKEVLYVLAFWELIWKGIALWKASKNDSKVWFVAILVANTAGILPIVYLLIEKWKSKQISN